MKKIMKNCGLLCIGLLTAGVFTVANAQRGGFERHDVRGGDFRREGGFGSSPVYSRGYAGGYHNNYYPNAGYRSVYSSPSIGFRSGYSPFFGPRYYGIPRSSLSITFGGNPYFYSGGMFYRPYGGYYRSVFPPIGLQIGILPPGYFPFYAGPDPYYFYNGIYYRPYNNGYQVVDAPMGAQLPSLPDGAKQVVVNGEKFYELNGTYYKQDLDSKGNTVFTVVGKNGEINNSDNGNDLLPQAPKVGDRVNELPANTKTITLNGETLYVSPDDTYYRKEDDGTYTVVGVAGTVSNTNNTTSL